MPPQVFFVQVALSFLKLETPVSRAEEEAAAFLRGDHFKEQFPTMP